MVIFIFFLVRKYSFSIDLIQNFERVVLRRYLVPIFEFLIDVLIFCTQNIIFPPPPHPDAYLLLEKIFNPSLKRYTYADFFAISQNE